MNDSISDLCRNLNTLARWLCQDSYTTSPGPADLLVLFGGTSLSAAEKLNEIRSETSVKSILLTGGYGHTTERLKGIMEKAAVTLPLEKISEAALFDAYIRKTYGWKADGLEMESSNCGANVEGMKNWILENHLEVENLIFVQDPGMCRRMEVLLKRQIPNVKVRTALPFIPEFAIEEGEIVFLPEKNGEWRAEEFATLMLGEISRLRNDENGYGPKGMNFFDEIVIPDPVLEAALSVEKSGFAEIRKADSAFSSGQKKKQQT